MPADVLEKSTALEDAPQGVSQVGSIVTDVEHCARPQQNVSDAIERKPANPHQRIEAWLHKVFEDREEFLGWTPD